nr:PREDICTED: SNARE-associated protein Snapin [Struthio camelus australis]
MVHCRNGVEEARAGGSSPAAHRLPAPQPGRGSLCLAATLGNPAALPLPTCCPPTRRLARACWERRKRENQAELHQFLDSLATKVCRINEDDDAALDLGPCLKRLLKVCSRKCQPTALRRTHENSYRLSDCVATGTVPRAT